MGMHVGPPITGGSHRTFVSASKDCGIWNFTSSDTLITDIEITCSVLIVGAGGGGGYSGGGGSNLANSSNGCCYNNAGGGGGSYNGGSNTTNTAGSSTEWSDHGKVTITVN